jgi:hypothetical protein
MHIYSRKTRCHSIYMPITEWSTSKQQDEKLGQQQLKIVVVHNRPNDKTVVLLPFSAAPIVSSAIPLKQKALRLNRLTTALEESLGACHMHMPHRRNRTEFEMWNINMPTPNERIWNLNFIFRNLFSFFLCWGPKLNQWLQPPVA